MLSENYNKTSNYSINLSQRALIVLYSQNSASFYFATTFTYVPQYIYMNSPVFLHLHLFNSLQDTNLNLFVVRLFVCLFSFFIVLSPFVLSNFLQSDKKQIYSLSISGFCFVSVLQLQ